MSVFEEVATFPMPAEAEVVVSFLRANNIDASIENAHTNAAFGGSLGGPCRIVVPKDQLQEARRLLQSIETQ